MSLEKHFCPSPWFHIKVKTNGDIKFCRWGNQDYQKTKFNIADIDIETFFSTNPDLSDLRVKLLSGQPIDNLCNRCYQMEDHGKVSGRQRQLLKIGVTTDNFIKTLISSEFNKKFKESLPTGNTNLYPVDWQIDLGNYCNGACVFCNESSSSKLHTEFKKIGIISKDSKFSSWVDNPQTVEKFASYLSTLPKIQYIHFIGGEALIIPAFKTFVKKLVGTGASKNITIGFTTNLMVWDNELIELFKNFKQVNVGVSIETLSSTNDYVRYPSKINSVKDLLDKWVSQSDYNNWLLQIRITPTILSIGEILTIYDYAILHNVSVESCNFLQEPKFMRPTVLPLSIRKEIAEKISSWIQTQNQFDKQHPAIINTRNKSFAAQQIIEDAQSYINYLVNEDEEEFRLPDLVEYLKKLESNRKNSILDYLPEYEQLFRSAGY